jgi:hypothetical protein
MTYKTFLDLSEARKSRPDLRRMEKSLKKQSSYLGKIDKVYFFQFDTLKEIEDFTRHMMQGAIKYGDTPIYAEIDNPWYGGKDNQKVQR